MSDSHQNAREVFKACRRARTPAERARILDQQCGDDALLRERVEELLSAREKLRNNTLRQIAAVREQRVLCETDATHQYDADRELEPVPILESPSAEVLVGAHPMIGPYKLLQEIGQGGMGSVYMAEQMQPVRRKVALKIIKPGMDSKDVLARFEAERQVLAMMDHPSIAKVLDGGTTEAGRPYFVMELVHGTPITAFCDAANLTTRQRLALFVDVCRAVQHAHLKGIIHRDLKPSNVLVTMNDEKPLPKVIDFGVAKALSSPLTEKTLFTAYGQMVGTPLYMSPEQAQFSAQDVDVRSDIYSLGVLLYELLTGSPPFDKDTLKKSGIDEMRRLIREVDPPRPSARVNTLKADQGTTLSAKRGIDCRRLGQSLKGELDWIVMKALAKDRDRRYESASDLAQDIERHLGNEPVQACPPSWRYSLRKQCGRHRSAIASAFLLLAAIMVGAAFSIWYAVQAEDARQLADERLKDAELERAKAEKANQQFGDLLYAADMKLASDAIANSDIPRAVELLGRHITHRQTADLRGFEWSFFTKQTTQRPEHAIDLNAWGNDASLSPDGKWLAVGTDVGVLRVYEVHSWREFRSFSTSSESVGGVAWSPDGQSLAGACSNGKVLVWDVPTGKKRITIPAHVGGANDVVFAEDGQSLFSCGEDNLAKQWRLGGGKLEREFETHQRAVERIAVSPDGERLATASSDRTFVIWETATAKPLYQSPEHGGRVVCVAFAMDGRIAAGDILGHVSIYQHETGEEWQLPRQTDGVESLTFFKNGRWLATADRGGAIQLHPLDKDPENPDARMPILGEPLRWIAHAGRAIAIAATADGKRVITSGHDGLVRVWAPDIQALRWYAFSDFNATNFTVVSNDRFYVTGRGISAWDLAARQQIRAFPAANPHWEYLAASDDGRWLAVVRRKELAVFDSQSREKVQRWPLNEELDPHRLAISPDGRLLAICGYDDQTVHLFSRDSSERIREYPASQCNALAFSPNGRWLAAGHMNDLLLFDLSAPGESRVLKGHSNSLAAASFSPDGQQVATVSHDRLLKIWSLPDGREIFSIVAHQGWVKTVAFSPDGRTIATAGDDGQARLWHTATGQPLGALPPEGLEFRDLEFTPDGKRLVGMLRDAKLVIYDASSTPRVPASPTASRPSQPIVTFRGIGDLPGGPEKSIVNCVSRNGRFVAGHSDTAAGFDGIVWSEAGLRPVPIHQSEQRRDSIVNAISDDGRIIGQVAPGAFVRQDEGSAIPIGPRRSFPSDMTASGHIIVGGSWESDRWRAFRYQGDQSTFFPSSPKHKHALAVATTPNGKIVLGRAANAIRLPERLSLLFSDLIQDARPVLWIKQRLQLPEGFDEAYNWWPIGISDDGDVIVGVTWPQGCNFFADDHYRSGVAFRWKADEVTLLGTLANHQHSQPFGVSGDGRVTVGTCFCKRGHSTMETAFIWDARRGMRSLKDVLMRAGADVQGWEIHRGVAISSDGTTIAGDGVNPRGKKEGWVAHFPRGYFDASQDEFTQALDTSMNRPH